LIKRKLREQIKERTRAQTSKISLLDLFFGLLLFSIETTMVDLYSLCLVLVLYPHTFIDFSSPSFIPFISQAAGRREETEKNDYETTTSVDTFNCKALSIPNVSSVVNLKLDKYTF